MKEENSVQTFLKKFWAIVWKDDSLKGWIISIIFLFIVIKFIFFPVLNLVTGTTLPLAIVESCSMYHEGNIFSNFDSWWERREQKYAQFAIDKQKFEQYYFKNGFTKGDILFILGVDPQDIEIGDVIIFEAGKANPLIHRVVQKEINPETQEYTFSTIGDNNNGQLSIEKGIREGQIVGIAQNRLIPYIGWGKLLAVDVINILTGKKMYYLNDGFCEEN